MVGVLRRVFRFALPCGIQAQRVPPVQLDHLARFFRAEGQPLSVVVPAVDVVLVHDVAHLFFVFDEVKGVPLLPGVHDVVKHRFKSAAQILEEINGGHVLGQHVLHPVLRLRQLRVILPVAHLRQPFKRRVAVLRKVLLLAGNKRFALVLDDVPDVGDHVGHHLAFLQRQISQLLSRQRLGHGSQVFGGFLVVSGDKLDTFFHVVRRQRLVSASDPV